MLCHTGVCSKVVWFPDLSCKGETSVHREDLEASKLHSNIKSVSASKRVLPSSNMASE